MLIFAYVNFLLYLCSVFQMNKLFLHSGQPFQESSQKFTIFKILTQFSSQPFSGLVIGYFSGCQRDHHGIITGSSRDHLAITLGRPRPHNGLTTEVTFFKKRLHLITNRARKCAIFLYISKKYSNFAPFLA